MLGDLGNPNTFSFPVLYEKVEGALPSRIIRDRDRSLLLPFLEAAKTLEGRGAKAITTSCGFLALWQKEMASAVRVPLFTSSLIQIPWAYDLAGRRGRIGVLTADREFFSADHLKGVNAEAIPIVIRGMKPDSAFHRTYVSNRSDLDFLRAEKEVVEEASEMVKEHPDIQAIVLECTNMAVFRHSLKEAINRPVFDILTLIHYVHSSLT